MVIIWNSGVLGRNAVLLGEWLMAFAFISKGQPGSWRWSHCLSSRPQKPHQNNGFVCHNLYPLFTSIYIMIVNINNLPENWSSLSPYGYIYSICDHLCYTFYTSIRCSRYQDLLQFASIILEILLYFVLHNWLIEVWSPFLWSVKDQNMLEV